MYDPYVSPSFFWFFSHLRDSLSRRRWALPRPSRDRVSQQT
jgi:hypothetical protein